jgi:hypothetical protein
VHAISRAETSFSAIRCNNDFALKEFALDRLDLALSPRFFVERESGRLAPAFLGFLKERLGTKT